MATDAYGNYVVGLNSASASGSGAHVGMVMYGSGAPTTAPAAWQAVYIDETNGDAYVNHNGSWTALITGSISGVTGVYTWNGVGSMPTAVGAAILIGITGTAAEGLLWKKTSAGSNNTDWEGV